MKPFAYSASNINIHYDQLDGDFHVFKDLSSLVHFLKSRGVFPQDLVLDNYSKKWKLEMFWETNERADIDPNELVEKIELTEKELKEIEEFVESRIKRQEDYDAECLKNGVRAFRLSGMFICERKDKPKMIENLTIHKSYKWKTLDISNNI